VTLPLLLLLLDVWPMGRLTLDSKSRIWPIVREKVPLVALAATSSIITVIAQGRGGAVGGLEAYPLFMRIANALVTYVTYIGQMLWPANLVVLYPYPNSVPAWQVIGSVVILAGISIVAIRFARQRPYFLVGWLWYLGTLVPVIGLVQVGIQSRADRY